MGAVFPWSVRSLNVCRRNIEMAGHIYVVVRSRVEGDLLTYPRESGR